MSKNLQSPTKLTEFAPLQSEEKPQSVGQFISNFFKTSKGNIDEQNSASPNASSIDALPSWATDTSSESSFPDKDSDNVYKVEVNEERTLPNVLKRISNLLALKSNNLQEYADTKLKQYWMKDEVSKECYECSKKFTIVRRKHHCRVCGQIFCSQCCYQHIPGKIFGCTGDLRVCTYCCKVVLSYLESSDIGADLSADLKLLQENLQSKFRGALSPNEVQQNLSPNLNLNLPDTNNTLKRKISVGYQEEKFASGGNSVYLTTEEKCRALQNSMSLRNLFEEICKPTTGISFETHRYRLRAYSECFLGSELVDWLIFQQKAKTRVQAAAICQALLEGNYIESVSEPYTFVDGYALYKKGVVISPSLPQSSPTFEAPLHEEPSWVQQIPHESSMTDSDNDHLSPITMMPGRLNSSSSYDLDLNLEAHTAYLSRPPESPYTLQSPTGEKNFHETPPETTVVRPSEQSEVAPESEWFNAKELREENQEREAYNCLTETYEHHEQCLAKQLLSTKGLSHSWGDVIIPLVHDIVSIVRPDKNHDAVDLDIRHYVQFKKLSAGDKKDTKFVRGIVCSKNVAHKAMSVDIENPKMLLLQCPIVYQRTEGRLMSLEPVLMQEHEYLKNVAARIVELKPDIVLVQRNVSRLAQDMLREKNITLVHNLKQNVLERIAKCTDADLVNAVDSHIGQPKLGTCKRFYVQTFNVDKGGQKTLMFFEGLPFPHSGGTVLLRGGSRNELSRLKKVASFMLYSAYNWRLEKSFLMDEFALPPNSRCEFLDDSRENSPDKPKPKVNIEDIVKPQENVINEVKKIAVDDFTDPLHCYNTEEHNNHKETEKIIVAKLPFSNSFRKLLDDTILCVSPYIVLSIPYLETDQGKNCKLRKYFPKEIYYSEQFNNHSKAKFKEEENNNSEESDKKLGPIHPFLTMQITSRMDSPEIQNQLALFRACGGRYKKRELICNEENETKKEKPEHVNNKDVFDPHNHQKLAVLFCSFSHKSNNAPAFCVNPWVVFMDFYDRNDIPLGCFLERYCFRPTYMCPSKTCDTPMIQHIRRFVHNSGCVSISLKHFESGFSEENIVMWTWCTKCQGVSPVVPMSTDTWSYPFAKYLELKFHGDVFSRRGEAPCRHSLHHDHYQYFGYKNFVASFKYTSIVIWEVSLPNLMIEFSYDMTKWQNVLIDDIRLMSQKGHEIFSLIQDKISCLPIEELEGLGNLKQLLSKEQSHFKQNIEEVQLKLTSPSIENKNFDEKTIHVPYWKISDTLVKIKRSIFEAVECWNLRLSEAAKKRDTEKRKERPISIENESPVTEAVEIQNSVEGDEKDSSSPMNRKMKSLDHGDVEASGHPSPKSHHRSQSDAVASTQVEEVDGKKDLEKTTMKTILDKLKPTQITFTLIPSPFSNQEHYTLPTGVTVPIIVCESEPSSIVAYALNSFDYKKAFEELAAKKLGEQTPSPVVKRKNATEKDKVDGENSGLVGFLRSRGSRTDLNSPTYMSPNFDSPTIEQTEKSEDQKKSRNSHIEVQFQDATCNFFCRIYLAEKFATLRAAVLPLGEEAYIRSLTRSVEWKAKGGKSGSNFSKTTDDRFILKDMSKNEITLFLESASNYFTYMHKCVVTKQPTLLGKIVGIYQIIFKNNSNVSLRTHFLVMENLFYNRDVTQKFDLKGSMRNRLVVPDNQEGEIVLLDENLLKMTCDSPLYILPHSKAVLTAAIQNDTEFLSAQSVMDYSLLVGLDSKNKELVLGIIDYIRTFTWDKKFEAMVKKTGILGGQGKLPTIISPEEYQKRFIEAMHRYFLEVPDHWEGLGKGLEI